ncbi:unnamed protein product [Clonostachys chloroleuca]|uniref:UDP-glucose:glycoprotein glucosyltransferase n=1 Tax=Clonostachys chloroleuca TaxID=1926264 RepID=A0AA35MEN4_9HYPO|nr:unnamed protein product [Clonostachys chloroleuca]
MLRFAQLPWSLFGVLIAALQANAAPSVNIGMRASFPAGPYLLELLETSAGENATSYFPLLDRIASGHFATQSTEAELYASFLDVLRDEGHISSPEALSTFNLALSLRTAAPRVQAQYQYYDTAVEPKSEAKEKCSIWVLIDTEVYCDPSLEHSTGNVHSIDNIELPFDRAIGNGKDAILYADPASPAFGKFHNALSDGARQGKYRYKLRYRRGEGQVSSHLPVGGYGVELALKRTDYVVIDDREAEQAASQQPLKAEIALDDEEEVADLKPLSTSELASLGLKAASFILQSDSPFDRLVKVTQDLPKFSASIAGYEISEKFIKEYEQNGAPNGLNYLWMNGVQLISRQVEPFTLIDMVRRERKLLSSVLDLGFDGIQAVSLLGHTQVAEAKAADGATRYDWTDRPENGKAIMWLNDIENDELYASYPRGLQSLLQRTYPGQIPQVRENIFHLILPLDLTNTADLDTCLQMIGLIQRGIPIRFGLVPLTSSAESLSQAKLGYYLLENYSLDAFLNYFKTIRAESITGADEKLLNAVVKDANLKARAAPKSWAEIFEADAYSENVKEAQNWSKRLGTNSDARSVFVNGAAMAREKNWMQAVSSRLAEDLQGLQMSVYRGLMSPYEWAPDFFLQGAASGRNTYITPEDASAIHILDVSKIYSDLNGLFDRAPVIEHFPESTKDTWAVLTVVADLTSRSGRELLLSSLAFRRNNPGIRLEIIHNPGAGVDGSQTNSNLKRSEDKLLDIETIDNLAALLQATDLEADETYNAHLSQLLSAANAQRGSQFLLLNGRVVGPISPEDSFDESDFQQLVEFEQRSRILPVYAALEDLGLSEKLTDPISAAKVTSVTALSTIFDLPEGIFESAPSIRTTFYDKWSSTHTAIEVGNPKTASVHIAGLLNPLSEEGQKWAPVLKVLSEIDGVYVKLFLNPKEKISELPVKRFYRYVLESKPSFDQDGKVKSPNATFKGLPSEALLTIGMDVPPAWLVAPKASVHDLDNIKLSSIKNDVEALYELENILIEGHSREGRGSPPKGAQLVLSTEKDPLLTDTIIMANLGYFQFKANPGFYNIQLKQGRSAEIYTIESVGAMGHEPVPGDEGTHVTLMDFQGTTLYPRLKRQPGMEQADVLREDDDDSDSSIVAKGLKFAGNLFGGSKDKALSTEAHAEINIFSVASGHLYERMLNIMMVSVMRNTKHTVKFWFIEQFLSPSFKDFIPHLAKEYGFKYEMVTYKWPHWLRQQKEKQREIWGYKILFLDVLFPLSLDKVIFVDADQVVRTDMMDLVNHDLEGAPYGFTPMCDSRTEMEGFRFWKQGYWENFLRGRPYHISALYVVDLRRFREMAAGDRLRQQYHTLSADPNSLSNLDQDLPNNMQFQIPIHSLPQEWLWCETWCSDESLSQARTIDLCNNPETKEPKLDRARRQVPEWTVYDDEIAAVDRRRRASAEQEDSQASTKSGQSGGDNTHKIDEL